MFLTGMTTVTALSAGGLSPFHHHEPSPGSSVPLAKKLVIAVFAYLCVIRQTALFRFSSAAIRFSFLSCRF